MTETELNDLSSRIIGACIEVHRFLGPGLLESIYRDCLCHEMDLRRMQYNREVIIPVIYKDKRFNTKLRADIIVKNAVIIELKSVPIMLPIFAAQVMTYLSLSGIELGLLINFNVPLLKDGITRMRLNHGRMSQSDVDLLMKTNIGK